MAKADDTNFFKILFINVQTLSKLKIIFLLHLLNDFNAIFLTEINYKQQLLSDIPLDACQVHFDPLTPRLAMICTHSTNFTYKGPGILIQQARVQNDQTAAQSNLYRINFENNKCMEIENTYIVPDIYSDELKQVKQHFSAQSQKSISYVAGGDFNINWYESNKKKKFKIPTLTQNVTSPTRIKHTKRNGRDRVSKTLIDLIFSNEKMDFNIVESSILKPDTSFLSSNAQNSLTFDHFGVTLSTNFKFKHKYRDVLIPHDPFRRPDPTEQQKQLISGEISQIRCNDNYDEYMLELKRIFDRYIPENRQNGFYTKRFYDVPYSKEIREHIKTKNRLRNAYRLHPNSELLLARNKQRNLVTKLTRNYKKDFQNDLLTKSANLYSVKHVYKTIQCLQSSANHHKPPSRIVIDGHHGTGLANHMGRCFQSRADLVPTALIDASPNLFDTIEPHEYPENTLEICKFPPITEIDKVIPVTKTTKTASMDTISGAILKGFWDVIQPKMNSIFENSDLFFPQTNQGYYQRVISKSDKKQPQILKDMRPLGLLNVIPKYHFAKHVFTRIRDHTMPVFISRKVYTYHGCRLPIVNTIDNAVMTVYQGFFTAIVKYDFSNAFGTIYPERLDQVMSQLNVSDQIRRFVLAYFENQAFCQTLFSDPVSGIHTSEILPMPKGGAQGQVGMDVCFSIQQLPLTPAENVDRNEYMDDLNDNLKNCRTPKQAVNLAISNDTRLNNQSIRVGFAKNVDKTTYIPINIEKQEFTDAGIDDEQVVSKSGILGFDFEIINGKFDVTRAANNIISSLNQHLSTIHSTRTYIPNNHLARLKIARTLIYYHLLFLPLIYAYGDKPSGKNHAFDRVQIKINDLIRATGLVGTTPTRILNICFGTSLKAFVEQQIITDDYGCNDLLTTL